MGGCIKKYILYSTRSKGLIFIIPATLTCLATENTGFLFSTLTRGVLRILVYQQPSYFKETGEAPLYQEEGISNQSKTSVDGLKLCLTRHITREEFVLKSQQLMKMPCHAEHSKLNTNVNFGQIHR